MASLGFIRNEVISLVLNLLCEMLLIFFCIFLIIPIIFNQSYEVNICGKSNNARLFLQYNESIQVVAKNSALNNNNYKNNSSFKACSVEFVTCPSCVINFKFSFINVTSNCDRNYPGDSCNCDFVWIYETQYEKLSGGQFCGRYIDINNSELAYKSQTRSLKITFIYLKDSQHAFTAKCTSERNSKVFIGHPHYLNLNNSTNQWITSPFFPNKYPMDLSNEYIIKCESKERCRISLTFTDYKVGLDSILEFFDTDGQRIYVCTGNIFRPPIIITSGPLLTIRFYANGHAGVGFKAKIAFFLGENTISQPSLDCGGWVNDLGGGITMINATAEDNKLYDCTYIIKPSLNFYHMKTHLFMKVIEFKDFAGNADLVIRQGSTSEDPLVEVLKHPLSQFMNTQKEHIAPISDGFYLHFKGMLSYKSKMVVVYSAFNYKDCFAGTDFLCRNLRCISVLLTCDGFDHCGDNSDEEINCIPGEKNRQQWTKIPHFIFPPVNNYSDLTTATLIFLSFSFGFVGLVFGMAIYFYRSNLQAQTRMQIQEHLDTIHAILSEEQGDIEEELIIPDDPPDYEAPPNYEEIIKKNNAKLGLSNNGINISTSQMSSTSNSDKIVNSISNRPQIVISPQVLSQSLTIPESPPPIYTSTDMMGPNKSRNKTAGKSVRLKNLPSNFLNATPSSFQFFKTSLDSMTSQDIKRALSESRVTPCCFDKDEDFSGHSTSRYLWYCKRSFSYDDVVHLLK